MRNRIVCGTMENALRERLLRETGLTLDKCVSMCRAAETTRAQAKERQRGETSVHAIHKEPRRNKTCTKQKEQRENSVEFKCRKCERSHKPKSCTAFGKLCNCGKSNHYGKCCKAASRQKAHTVQEDEDDEFIMNIVQACTTEKEEWIVPIELNQTIITFKLDTGAHVNLISLDDYKRLTSCKNTSDWLHWRTCSCKRWLYCSFQTQKSTA